MELLIITGMSGAGKSCVVKSLEDAGFFCMDNLPAALIPVIAASLKNDGGFSRVAFVSDIRAGGASFSQLFGPAGEQSEKLSLSKSLDGLGVGYRLMFIDAEDDVLIKRYKQTRRSHPLQANGDAVSAAVSKERSLLLRARENADYYLDTTNLSATECRVRVLSMFSNGLKQMHIECLSFGFKHGAPHDADFVFDVRFLPNPFYVPQLKTKTGLDNAVSSYVMGFPQSQKYLEKLLDLVDFAVEGGNSEGRSQLVLAVGCTGGHHRSVTFAQAIYQHLTEKGCFVSVSHRDISK